MIGILESFKLAWKKRAGNKELLQFFVDIIPRALGTERCSIFILDPVNDDVWVQCGTGLSEKAVTVPKSGSLVGQVVSTGQIIIEEDMQSHVGAHDLVAMKTGFITRNAMCVPVHGVTTKRVTGAIQILNKKDGFKFSTFDRTTLEKLAFLLQMNIENIFLRQELSRVSLELKKQIELLEKRLKEGH